MILDFSWLPPEINSARIYAGAGSGPLFMAAAAWEGLAADLRASASSFDAVIAGLAAGPWSGPASVAMAGAAAPYVGWLSAAAGQAELSAGQGGALGAARGDKDRRRHRRRVVELELVGPKIVARERDPLTAP
ncbi:PPE family protein, partial [Mycobacterium tuberculosis]|uniref:PPE family protein n=1 Tax=Mycobacterium tuberculosis TaxID=1773 RepID=UPI0021BF286F